MHGEVIRTERLSHSLIRVVLGGGGLADFAGSQFTDAYVNCLFLPDGSTLTVPWDDETARAAAAEHRPRPRRLSVRRWDADAGELTLDIVSHGDVGYCGRWAGRARPGDLLQLRGPAGGYAPHPDADEYLFVGDESALPAIAASAEAVTAGKRVRVFGLVEAPEDEIALQSPGDLDVVWVHRSAVADSAVNDRAVTALADAVASSGPPAGRLSAFVHGEAAESLAVVRVLARGGWCRPEMLSSSPYWRRGMDDEAWRGVKGDWVRAMREETQALFAAAR
ncbi:siderophore-interacting protein [Microbacterium oleivorans]|uniref:Siderophore-interacting protein n=1 Tax=Microbacterium oleivorans TaxID=273677 RepID=A0A7D5EXZ7_9MICO|nr:siderophore-interacting protein [Microbacterium oleivorans]QLD12826.1 siderophore-interacting protein [Microbacterium oleivorans]